MSVPARPDLPHGGSPLSRHQLWALRDDDDYLLKHIALPASDRFEGILPGWSVCCIEAHLA